MGSPSLNHYEERLYSVFKTFDVGNEEALNKASVLALCDALQLEQRGAALVDTLFTRRDQRVTFAQFRSGLLAVLGDPPPTPAPAPAPTSAPAPAPAPAEPAASDDDSSGREVAPKFVFGSKKYGRRSRPPRCTPPVPSPSVLPQPDTPSPAPSGPSNLELDHSSRVDSERALQLCRRLQMEGIDQQLVERIFESMPTAEITVGEFFDRLNASLSISIDDVSVSNDSNGTTLIEGSEEEALPAELIVEAWERAGVQRPQRLLAELGFDAAALSVPQLECALDDEWRALDQPGDARGLLLLAALALARLRRERSAGHAAAAAAERDRLRSDVDEANRRAQLLAQEVDENHARLEAELAASLRRTEARHAEALRVLEVERATERERASIDRTRFQVELARRDELEQKLRTEMEVFRERCTEFEARATSAEERRAAEESQRTRLEEELRAAEEQRRQVREEAAEAVAAMEVRADELRRENARLRDRCDELCAQLEARARPAPPAPPPHSWHEEATTLAPVIVPITEKALENESPPVSLEPTTLLLASDASAEEVATLRAQLVDAESRHQDEKKRLDDLIRELEISLEQLRDEYERCEEYWSRKLDEERALMDAEQRASDERLADLVGKITEYERQFAPSTRLPAIAEAPALEKQAAELDAAAIRLQRQDAELQSLAAECQRRDAESQRRDAESQRRDAECQRREAELRRRHDELQRRERDLARLAATLDTVRRTAMGGCGGAGEAELRVRLARAEAGAARLAARLAAADLLVKDLYVENCMLGPAPRRL